MRKIGFQIIFLFVACLIAGVSASSDAISYTDSAGNTIGFAYNVSEDGKLSVSVNATSDDGTVVSADSDTREAKVTKKGNSTNASIVNLTAAGNSENRSADTASVIEDGGRSQPGKHQELMTLLKRLLKF